MSLVTLKTFDNAIDAHMVCSKLESEGINTFIFDENIVALNPLYNNLIGGIKVKISESDYDKTTEVLNEVKATPLTDENGKTITCPKCNAESISVGFKSMKDVGGILTLMFSFLLMVFPFYFKTVKKCDQCGFEFN
jgi:hypothetical protein